MQRLPTVPECQKMLSTHQPEPAVLLHSIMVTRVGLAIARGMVEHGHAVDVGRVAAGCMLHDICKLEKNPQGARVPRKGHAEAGAALVAEMGFPELAPLVANHVLTPNHDFASVEEEIVFYADKRVDWDEVVSIATRFERLLVRYRDKPNIIFDVGGTRKLTAELEERLMQRAGITAESLQSLNSMRGRGLEGLA